MASVIALKTRRIHQGNKTTEILIGEVYQTSSKVYKVFGPGSFISKPRATRNKYSVEEFTVMVEVYLKFADTQASLEDYWSEFARRLPQSLASRDGIICYMCIIRGLDVTNQYKGFNNPSHRLLSILHEVDADRFGADKSVESKLDAILATI